MKGLPAAASIAAKFTAPTATSCVSSLKSGFSGPQTLQGWLHRKPKKLNKGLSFVNIRDTKGDVIQLVDKNTPSLFKSLKPDSSLCVEINKVGNDLECSSVHVLGSANLVPGQLQAEETKEWPGKYRYIQLREPKFQQILRARAAILRTCRHVLDNDGFTEVETPLLFKSTPEGAREFLVPTRRKEYSYALPQSPQQYKQLLIASGIDKYYQVAKCFRDEDLRADRQPEFTQLDLEMGFAKVEDVQCIIEKVVKAVWSRMERPLKTFGGDGAQFSKLSYAECLADYGIDKPDLHSALKISQLRAVATGHPAYPVFEVIPVPSSFNTADFENPRVHFVQYTDIESLKTELASLAIIENWPQFLKELDGLLVPGNMLAFGDRMTACYENPTPLGKLRQQIVAEQHHRESVAVWVEQFPSFEPLELETTDKGYVEYDFSSLRATHHPFTMVNLNDYHYLESGEPLKCHGMHFDLVIDGVEVGGGSQRIHDSELQEYILTEVLGVKEAYKLFGHLLEALATGCPPHAGLAIGFDRMVAMLLGRTSIRDVIAFPKTMAGTDPVVGSPSKVTKSQLKPYGMAVQM